MKNHTSIFFTHLVHECFEKYIKKCNVRILSSKAICVYRKHYKILTEYIDGNSPIANITRDIIDDFIVYVKETDLSKKLYI